MTIPDWLNKTDLTTAEIAAHCGVDGSQVSRWKSDGNVPQGLALLRLIELSRGDIKARDIPMRKRGPKARRRGGKAA